MKEYIRKAIEEAAKILTEDHGIDLAQYGKAKWVYWTDPATGREDKKPCSGLVSGCVSWKHKKSGCIIGISDVYVNVEDGSIERYGSNSGAMIL